MLKVVNDKQREEEWAYQQAVEALKNCDKFIVMFEKDGTLEHVQFKLSNVELVYYAECLKQFIFNKER